MAKTRHRSGTKTRHKSGTTKAISSTVLAEITPALMSPDFDPSHVIVVVDVPAYPSKPCRSMPLESALAAIAHLCTMLSIRRGSIDQFRQQLAKTIAAGGTPIIAVWARQRSARIQYVGEVTIKRLTLPKPTSN